MGFESVFQERFNESTEDALRIGIRGAFVEGCTYGIASSLIYLSEALLFYAGAVLVAQGTYTYLRLVQVLNLVVFTVSIGSQLMSFSTFLFLVNADGILMVFTCSRPHCEVSTGYTRLHPAT
jgi:ATP-binding cassette, subfamily B (MDR/TAP), member 1